METPEDKMKKIKLTKLGNAVGSGFGFATFIFFFIVIIAGIYNAFSWALNLF